MVKRENRGQTTVSRQKPWSVPCFLLLAFLPFMAWAGAVDDLKQFLNGTKTLRAEFSQTVVGKTGGKPQQSFGVVSISRPGKLRWEIHRPYPQLMVGDGEKFWIYDQELAQVTVRKAGAALGSTPAALLSGSNDLERNFSFRALAESGGLSWVEAIPRAEEGGFEKVRLGFAEGLLRAMQLRDSFGQTTYLHFSAIERNPAFPPGHFVFVPPAGVDVLGD